MAFRAAATAGGVSIEAVHGVTEVVHREYPRSHLKAVGRHSGQGAASHDVAMVRDHEGVQVQEEDDSLQG